ncbi:acyltransferase family protein [Gordoniibacillus kamchatkensis]|uniref:acyltransferase family protein n=1 Tax=Gordoniibacillus kamchatkensis TaxID=1590651 RepID=UPI0006961EC3|nr:hypothetical protein [Paenibacillus sp. VKM B-2647]
MNKRSAAFVNNLKFVLISLVVAVNAIEPLIGRSAGLRTLYQTIYTFHIPMFVFAMGLLAKNFRFEHQGQRAMAFIAWQYVLFQTVYSLADAGLYHAPGIVYSFFVPYSLLWFLCSHFCWRAMLPLFLRLKHPLLTAVLFGLAAGYWPGSGALLSISRTFVFFPFFVAGYYFRMDQTMQERLRRWRLPATALAAIWCTALALYGDRLPAAWLYGNTTYAQMGIADSYAGLTRLALYAVQTVLSVAFLSWIPWTAKSWTGLGGRTLYVFLLHGLLLKAVIASGVYAILTVPQATVFAFGLAAALVILLSQRGVERLMHPVMEPSPRQLSGFHWRHKRIYK